MHLWVQVKDGAHVSDGDGEEVCVRACDVVRGMPARARADTQFGFEHEIIKCGCCFARSVRPRAVPAIKNDVTAGIFILKATPRKYGALAKVVTVRERAVQRTATAAAHLLPSGQHVMNATFGT